MINIILAEDHPAVRAGIRDRIGVEEGMQVRAEVGCGRQLMPALRRWPVDVLILDLRMPNFEPDRAIRQIKAKFPTIKILILSAFFTDTLVKHLLDAGANGYASKCESLDIVMDGIRAVIQQERWLSPRIIEVVSNTDSADIQFLPQELTPQENKIFELIGQGFTNPEIAAQLSVSLRTVKFHISNIYNKMGFVSRAEAILCYVSRPHILKRDSL